jgi:hypothetical protein
MARVAPEGVRSEALQKALSKALESDDRHFFALLARMGNLPSPRPNLDLAMALGDELRARGRAADALVREMGSLDDGHAPGNRPEVFMLFVAGHVYGSRLLHGEDKQGSWRALSELAGDARKPVRDGAITALIRYAAAREENAANVVAMFAEWTDGFLQASVALTVLADRSVSDRIHDEGAVAARVAEAYACVANAGRADERSQGRRRLIEALGETIPELSVRFVAVFDGLLELAQHPHVELRPVLEVCLERFTKLGVKAERLDELRRTVDASRPQLRDPTHYRGTTRGRGRKAEGRSDAKGRAEAARKRTY